MSTNPSTTNFKPAMDGQRVPVTASVDVKMEDVPAKGESETEVNGTTKASDGKQAGVEGSSHPTRLLDLSVSEPKIPIKKDSTLREFLGKMDDYSPIIPDAVINYYLTLAGLPPPPQTPPHLARLLALATQKFIADIATDAYQYARIRSSNATTNNPMGGLAATTAGAGAGPAAVGVAGPAAGKDAGAAAKSLNLGVQRPGFGGGGQGGSQGRTVLTMEDLGMAVGEYGVNIKRGEFYR